MYRRTALVSSILAAAAKAQQVGTLTTETHPSLPIQSCSTAGSCTTIDTSITIDANWRWLHTVSGYTNCYTGNEWDTSICPDGVTCAANCALDGADYSSTYGITTSDGAMTAKFITNGGSTTNVGSRSYLMASESKYYMFQLMNQEFTFDVDVSKLPCGLNGALYLVEMDEDGGMARFPTNKAGAKYGTGYCDTQCPHDIKFINGEANCEDWTPSPNDTNAGTGKYGTCCNEMDIWEANSISTAVTPHVCSVDEQTRCSGTDCGDGDERYEGVCDKDGCDFNPYRMGNTTFYGPDLVVDTTQPFTVVTQFISTDGTADGDLKEIRRKYVQNGVVIENSVVDVAGIDPVNSISDDYCNQQKSVFGDTNSFENLGGMSAMGGALKRGMVLALSIWDDHAVNMLWLDAPYPTDADTSEPGVVRGTCSTDSGKPSEVEADGADVQVIYSNIKIGALNSTFTAGQTSGSGSSGSGSTGSGSTGSGSSGTVSQWGQCGGIGYSGSTTCVSGTTCVEINDYYYQCQ